MNAKARLGKSWQSQTEAKLIAARALDLGNPLAMRLDSYYQSIGRIGDLEARTAERLSAELPRLVAEIERAGGEVRS